MLINVLMNVTPVMCSIESIEFMSTYYYSQVAIVYASKTGCIVLLPFICGGFIVRVFDLPLTLLTS